MLCLYRQYVVLVMQTEEVGWGVKKTKLQVGSGPGMQLDSIKSLKIQINGYCLTLRSGLNTLLLISEDTETPAKPIKRCLELHMTLNV